MDEHYGIYRNIYVREFRNTSLTRELESIVLFTSTYLHATDSDAAFTTENTFSSVAERRDLYAPISIIDKGNGTIAAFGDVTFITEPYVYVEDNYQILINIVSAIDEIDDIEVTPSDEEKPDQIITKPDLPGGTEKKYMEFVDGEEHEVLWVKLGENEVRVDRPDQTTFFYYDDEGGLLSLESDGWEQVFDTPLLDLPYPLISGKGWTYMNGYTLSHEEDVFQGFIEGKGHVEGFEKIETLEGDKYFSAKVKITETDELKSFDGNMTTESTELLWISSEVGLVKAEREIKYFFDGEFAFIETRDLILISINTEWENSKT
jgi:hypothetical protein